MIHVFLLTPDSLTGTKFCIDFSGRVRNSDNPLRPVAAARSAPDARADALRNIMAFI